VSFVEGQSRLAHALGVAYEVTGNMDDARKAWRFAVRGWERLMIEQLRRKSLGSSAGATFEVGRLYYLLGRRDDGLRKFDEAIEQDESRDQSYIDAIAFLGAAGRCRARARHLPACDLQVEPRGLGIRQGLRLAVDPGHHPASRQCP
jgi:tetratricopeptide (TPR) repeat protein